MHRLSFAIASLALLVSLSGTAYAVSQIDGRLLRDRSVPGAKIRAGSLTGVEIRESSLAAVPTASNALRLGGRVASSFAIGGGRVVRYADALAAEFDGEAFGLAGAGRLEATCDVATNTASLRWVAAPGGAPALLLPIGGAVDAGAGAVDVQDAGGAVLQASDMATQRVATIVVSVDATGDTCALAAGGVSDFVLTPPAE